ncbi:efflux RND transporter permease subunit [Thiolapillus sp.]|uniref:efflux RND transporter permease subunit n=2 Tax=Thiolapillus sp. TaxID=2017437 RepID=UPI0026004917|nr:MMPL family transporter [Thiolapillus sp.]
MSQAYFIWILRHRWLVVILSVILIALAASGARFLGFSNDYRMFFSEENPQLLAFEALQNTYTKTDNILFVVSPRDGNVFTPKTLATVEWLTKESWQLPYSLRVDSITNYQHTEAEEDDLLVADLVEDAANLTDEQLKKIRDVALHEPLLRNRLISPDGAHTGINITVQLPGKKLDEVPEVADFAYKLAQRAMEQNPDVEVRVTGLVAMNATFPKMAQNDMQTLYPLMLLIILVTMAFMLRSISGVVVSMLVLLMAVFATLGLTGWLGMQMSPPTTSAPVMVMTLAVADCIHIIVLFLQGLRKGEDKETAMLESLRLNLGPVFLTSITTAIGFLSLNFSDAPPFRDLGNMAAMGVMVALLLSLSFLPALLMILPVKASTRHTRGQGVMERLGDFVIRKCTPLFWGMAALIVLLVSQVPRNHLNDEFIKYFSENVPFRVDTDYAVEHLTGIYLLEYSLPAGGEGMIANPEYLQHVEAFANWLRQQPEVLHVNTITDIMKRLNKNMHGDDPSWYKLPDNQELAAQYLLLYEFSLPFGLDLNNQINVRKSATRLTASLKSISSEQLLTLDQKAAQWLKDNVPAYIQTHGASPSVMFANIGHRNIRAMLKGTTVALVLISLILMFSLRSVRIGLLSLIPNLAPIGMAFGFWGLFVGQVGLALSVVSGMTIGIVVDDTVHFLSKYLRARREQGLSSEQAVRYAFHTVGTALWVTTLVLMLGFGVLAFSDFELNAGMGLLTAITIGLALLADFLFLPPLLMKFGDKQK